MNQNGINSVNGIANYARLKEIVHLTTDDREISSMIMSVEGQELVNFGSCSYLGLEFDKRLKEASIEAINKYGTQFSASRAYVSINLYKELELNLEKIFGAPTIVAPTTTLGHSATIPVIIEDEDAIILDHQVHGSVQMAVGLLKSRNIHVEMVRHNKVDLIEEKIKLLQSKYKRVWYMADGIYSMYGDETPIEELYELMDNYSSFHCYIDDAHGMSCFGQNGRGFVLNNRKMHSKLILATSFAKAFATGGGAIIFPNKEIAQKVRNCGGPFNSSGPMQPAALGAAVKCSEIHLSSEIKILQNELQEKILFTHLLLKKYGLPDVSEKKSPIFFVAASLPKVGYNMIDRMKKSGHFLNIGIFPTVPMKNTGVRFTITRLHTFEQIERMVSDMAYHYPLALKEENYPIDKVYRAFKISPPENIEIEKEIERIIEPNKLSLEHYNSIIDVNKNDWNSLLGSSEICNWDGLNLLENSFKNNSLPEENWNFDYVMIRDAQGKIVLSTFLTSGFAKDDMLATSELSQDIEKLREADPYFYTSKFLCVGSMITEGNHLYIDKNSELANLALQLLFDKIDELQKKYNATTLIIRDLPSDDSLMDDMMVDNGFFKSEMPENYSLDISDWNSDESYSTTLSKRSKRHFKENVVRFEHLFEVNVIQSASESQLSEFYNLYSNVFDKSLEINTFKLPKKFFEVASKNDNWEILNLSLKENPETSVGAILLHKGQNAVTGVIVGLDYELNYKFNVYRQSIYQLITRAKGLGYSKINFGFSAGIEKKKFGAVGHNSCAYMQVKDNFKFESLMTGTFRKEVKDEVAQLD